MTKNQLASLVKRPDKIIRWTKPEREQAPQGVRRSDIEPNIAMEDNDAERSLQHGDSRRILEGRENHIETGRNGEAVALTYLLRLGYVLRDRNVRFGRGELDLVMDAPEGDLVFIEVKTSRQDRAGDPAAWVTPRKQLQIARVAQGYCLQRGLLSGTCDRPMRFDVVAVEWDPRAPDGANVRHIPHAFIPDGAVYFRTWT
jgi:putative endonuclease